MTIEEMKEKFINGELEKGLYTSGQDKIVKIDDNGFSIGTIQNNGWTRSNTYEYIDNTWVESESYEK